MVPKMNYLCRTLGPAAALLADLFSKHILTRQPPFTLAIQRLRLYGLWKIKDGGLGLQLPSLLLTPAYLSSLCLVAKDLDRVIVPDTKPKRSTQLSKETKNLDEEYAFSEYMLM
jgi:hypothetical protein